MSNQKQVRVILWSTPRSLSTAFLKSISTFQNVELFQEPFVSAALFGPDRNRQATKDELNTFLDNFEGMENYTFDGVKAMLEMDYPDKDIVFSKDGAQFMPGHFDKIPVGYKHVFLTRSPGKLIMSSKKMVQAMNAEDHQSFMKILPGSPYRQLFDLMEHVRDNLNQTTPFVIDADDLQMKPREVMRAFCDYVGIEYSDKMMTWETGPDPRWRRSKMKEYLTEILPAHDKVFNSTGFDEKIPTSEPSLDEMDEKTRKRVTDAQPYYEKLMEYKLNV